MRSNGDADRLDGHKDLFSGGRAKSSIAAVFAVEAWSRTEFTRVYAGSRFEDSAMDFFLVDPAGFGNSVVFEVVEDQFLNRKSFETSGQAVESELNAL